MGWVDQLYAGVHDILDGVVTVTIGGVVKAYSLEGGGLIGIKNAGGCYIKAGIEVGGSFISREYNKDWVQIQPCDLRGWV